MKEYIVGNIDMLISHPDSDSLTGHEEIDNINLISKELRQMYLIVLKYFLIMWMRLKIFHARNQDMLNFLQYQNLSGKNYNHFANLIIKFNEICTQANM